MAVPTPPTAGEPIAEAWGDVVHDAVVAMDIQSGKQTMTLPSGQAEITTAITFPRPFASAPVVVLGPEGAGGVAGRPVFGRQSAVTTTGFTMTLQCATGAASGSVGQTTHWLAYGPRA